MAAPLPLLCDAPEASHRGSPSQIVDRAWSVRVRHDNWSTKAIRRKTTGTGRMRHLKIVHRRFRNGFKEVNVKKAVNAPKVAPAKK
ncbi:unnamed protein product [Notodromas monacha]|uniref:60S ribosomal protein L37 n=1 Tax=Notodromas monacha TaxID=399045 RepID=A0A7R9BC00_9CRUS|nr:unnamed protein product [Notodromas monacha]CAG0912491.1 unnamed protein product [Notodromas monacha]